MPIDIKQWLAAAAAEAGLSEAEKSAAEKLMGSNKFRGDFVPLPDFHSALDKQKRGFQQEYEKVMEMNTQWQDKYETEYRPALNALQKLQESGFDTRGARQDELGNVRTVSGEVLTPEAVERMIAARIEPVRVGAIDWGTFVADKAVEYSSEYNKRFNAAEFRRYAYENREQYPTYESAYDAYTAADRKVKEEKEREDWKTSEREKMRLELLSNQNLPEMAGDGGAPLFIANNQKEDAATTPDSSRQAFVKHWAGSDFSKVNI